MSQWNDAMKMRAAGINIDHIGSFLFESGVATDPADMVPTDPDLSELADAPPPVSGYRKANVQGIACWNCGHFSPVDDWDNDGIVDGACNLWESKAEGEDTCDRFTAHADMLRQSPHTSWTEDMAEQLGEARGPSIMSVDYADNSALNEIFLSGEATEEDGLVWKEILRTGKWTHTPTNQGIVKRALSIIRDGDSDPVNGVISLSEVHRNFEDQAVPYVTIPLSDDTNDHKNLARLNTGFVRKLKLVDRDGISVLVAGMDFTEEEVKDKVLRGTIPDVSAGIPFGVTRRRDNKTFNTVLDHVCLTRKPFIDGLTPFGLAAADDTAQLPVEAYETESEGVPTPPEPENAQPSLSFVEQQKAIGAAMRNQLRLPTDYQVEDINSDSGVVTVRHRISGTRWNANYAITGESEAPVRLDPADTWTIIEEREQESAPEQIAASNSDHLQRAHELRELRLSQPTSNTGGIQMSTLSLDGVELSELPEDARARVQSILDENSRLRRTNREGEVSDRITALEALGLKDRPGALKFYREVMLSDDGGPALILFADSDDESKKERLTALQVLDRFIDSLKADGSVTFSDQALQSGNDTPPPKTPEGELKPLEERVEETRVALYGSGKRTGRK